MWEEARRLKKDGWNVQADLSGYDRPDTIGDKYPRRPDIVARKSGAIRMIEVETDRGADQRQREVFRRSAAQRNRTHWYNCSGIRIYLKRGYAEAGWGIDLTPDSLGSGVGVVSLAGKRADQD